MLMAVVYVELCDAIMAPLLGHKWLSVWEARGNTEIYTRQANKGYAEGAPPSGRERGLAGD